MFDLDPAKTIVSSRLQIVRAPGTTPTPLRLHGEALTLLRVQADGASVSFRHEGGEPLWQTAGAGANATCIACGC